MNKIQAIDKIQEALKEVIEKSNNYGMVSWKWDEVKDKIKAAEDALDYLKSRDEEIEKFKSIAADYEHTYIQIERANNKLIKDLQEIINTGLCNLPDVRCDDDMFNIAWKSLNPEKKTIKCPECGCVYHKSLYDYYYIRCTEQGCGTFFDKETGDILETNDEGQLLNRRNK